MEVTASIDTPHGKQYLRKLCMHFARMAPATFTDTKGLIDFPFGSCRIFLGPGHMRLTIETGSPRQADEAERTLQEPMLKIVSRDKAVVTWHRKPLGRPRRTT